MFSKIAYTADWRALVSIITAGMVFFPAKIEALVLRSPEINSYRPFCPFRTKIGYSTPFSEILSLNDCSSFSENTCLG